MVLAMEFAGRIVATALTVYGIETGSVCLKKDLVHYALQQHLPFTVLKLLKSIALVLPNTNVLQQHLPFTVLKHSAILAHHWKNFIVATALTVYGIETVLDYQ